MYTSSKTSSGSTIRDRLTERWMHLFMWLTRSLSKSRDPLARLQDMMHRRARARRPTTCGTAPNPAAQFDESLGQVEQGGTRWDGIWRQPWRGERSSPSIVWEEDCCFSSFFHFFTGLVLGLANGRGPTIFGSETMAIGGAWAMAGAPPRPRKPKMPSRSKKSDDTSSTHPERQKSACSTATRHLGSGEFQSQVPSITLWEAGRK